MRTRTTALIACAVVLGACGGQPATPAPDQGTRLMPGQTVEGVLRDTTPTYGDRGRFHLYHFQGTQGVRYGISLESENFDTYLTVGDRSQGLFNPVETDDDGGSGLNSRIHFEAPRTGTYLVVAQALGSGSDDVGIYTIGLEELGEPTPAVPTRITVGQSARGTLAFDDPVLEGMDDRNYDLYSFEAASGERYAISLASDDFDTYLDAGPLRGNEVEVRHTNDDGGNGTDSRLIFTADRSGTYGIRARAYSSGFGDYTLSVQRVPDPGPLTAEPIGFGEMVRAELSFDDHVLDDGSYFDLYSFQAKGGERVTISLSSDDFDTYLSVGQMRGGTMNVMETDDDGGDGLDSRLTFNVPSDGEYHIRAEALGSGETGWYTLTVEIN